MFMRTVKKDHSINNEPGPTELSDEQEQIPYKDKLAEGNAKSAAYEMYRYTHVKSKRSISLTGQFSSLKQMSQVALKET